MGRSDIAVTCTYPTSSASLSSSHHGEYRRFVRLQDPRQHIMFPFRVPWMAMVVNLVLLAMATLGLVVFTLHFIRFSIAFFPSAILGFNPPGNKGGRRVYQVPIFSQRDYRVTEMVAHLDCVNFILHGQ